MKRLYIMEKPSLATAVAGYLWPRDFKKLRTDKCYEGQLDGVDTVITWTVGHAMRSLEPGEYFDEWKAFYKYPVIPDTWEKKVDPSKKDQMAFIKKQLQSADEVVNGGDPDREGQLLVDEVLEYYKYKGPVKRILINAYDDESLRRAFKSIKEDSEFRNLYYAGLTRERADWLYGMNCSRAYTINGNKFGMDGTMRIGRVKTPTLALVVRREREIEKFKPQDYYLLNGNFIKDGITFKATYVPPEDMTDSEGRVLKKGLLEGVMKKLSPKGTVDTVETKSGKEYPPLPYSLDSLQVDANKKYKMSPKQVLDTAQSLYEKKFVTYPRSDCNYIPDAQHEDGNRILPMLADYGIKGASGGEAHIKSKAFNDKKVSAHHAIIPTFVSPKGLNEEEAKLYEMIAQRYVLQFYSACEFDTTTFTILVGDALFKGTGKLIKKKGFRVLVSSENAEEVVLPKLAKGDVVDASFEIGEKTTTPPKRFTEGTLIAAMTNVWRFVSDKETKEMLKECKGIGTPATRDKIISELMTKYENQKEPYIKKVKNELVPTDLGRALIDNVSEHLASPEFTAIMEYNLGQIAEGKMSMDEYMDEILDDVMDCISHAEDPSSYKTFVAKDGVLCPECEKAYLRRVMIKKFNRYVWICPDDKCLNENGKKTFYEDKDGKPVIIGKFECSSCGHRLKRVRKKDGTYAWICPSDNGGCGKWYEDNNAEPLYLKSFKCTCGAELRRIHKKDGTYVWHCDNCNKWLNDENAEPVFPKEEKCVCGGSMTRIHKKDGTYAWHCNDCNKWFNDINGKPFFPKEEKCKCGELLKRVRKKDGTFAWVCGSCNTWYDDEDGKPVPQKPKNGNFKKKGA